MFFGAPKSLQMVTAAMKLKDACSLEGTPLENNPEIPPSSQDEALSRYSAHPRHDPIPDPRRPASPRPGRAPGALPTFTTGSR